jgi:predicted permease
MNLFRRTHVDREIDAELASHLAMRTEENVAAGMDPKQARRSALVSFGNPTLARERTVEADAALYLESLWADIRYALRQLIRSPGFALTAVLTLALGVGANLAVFQLLHCVLFGHLPIPEPQQLYAVRAAKTPFDGAWYLSYAAYRHLREAQPASAPVFAHSWIGEGVLQQPEGATGSSTSRVAFQLVSDNLFDALGLHPALGRFFLTGEDQRLGSEWPVILRYGFFEQHFGADPAIVGKHFVVNGLPVVVVGVAPKGFSGLLQWSAADIWFPLAAQSTIRLGTAFDSLGPGFGVDLDKPWEPQPTIFWLTVLTRAPLAAQPALSARWTAVLQSDIHRMASVTKDPHERAAVEASQVQFFSAANGEGGLHRRYATPLTILMAMSGTILLVGCLNLANLQLARLTQREREFAIRIALGASRARILRQVAMEALMLALAGGLLALVTSRVSSALLLQWASGRGSTMPLDLSMTPQTGLLCALLLFAAVAAFGLLPAWHIASRNLPSMESSRSSKQTGQTKAARRWSNALLATQVCFSLLLISAAALFAQTLRTITQTDTGMDRDQILSVHVDMRSTGFADRQKDLNAFETLMLDRIQSLPMVRSAAVSMCDIPMCGWNTFFHVFGHPELSDERLHGEENHVSPGYFRTLGISILEGRDFNEQDTLQTQRVAILNRAYARQLFGEQSPVGHWIGYNAPPGDHSFLIVGETADALLNGPRNPAPAVAYLSVTQDPAPIGTIEVRARGSIHALPADLRSALQSVAPTLPITEITPLAIELEDGLTTEQLLARLTTVFGVLALALAALGFYGLLSFRVARRTSEIGIRMALGATRGQVQSMFLRQTLLILLAGILPGAGLSFALHGLLDRLMDIPNRADARPLTVAVLVLASAGLLATLIPARRAASVNPTEALRSE